MRKIITLLILSLAAAGAQAQDIILLRSADEINAKVVEITDTEIKYREAGSNPEVLRTLARSSVFSITYENGERDVFKDDTVAASDGAYPYPPVTRCYEVGDLFSEGGVEGIVVRVDETGRHGLLVSLKHTAGIFGYTCSHIEKDGVIRDYRPLATGAADPDDGWRNMLTVEDIIANTPLTWDNFSAFKVCREQGAGWYLPAIHELECLLCLADEHPVAGYGQYMQAMKRIGERIEEAGGDKLKRIIYYISSTERTEQACELLLWENEKPAALKRRFYQTKSGGVRAFHKF